MMKTGDIVVLPRQPAKPGIHPEIPPCKAKVVAKVRGGYLLELPFQCHQPAEDTGRWNPIWYPTHQFWKDEEFIR